MKRLVTAFSVFCFSLGFLSTVQAGDPVVIPPAGFQPAASRAISSRMPIRVELECSLYKFRVENGLLKESQLLLNQKSNPVELGMFAHLSLRFPAPYDEKRIHFNHMVGSALEEGNVETPYVQAFFSGKAGFEGELKDANFDFIDVKPGTQIKLRDTLLFDQETLLTYNCYLRAI